MGRLVGSEFLRLTSVLAHPTWSRPPRCDEHNAREQWLRHLSQRHYARALRKTDASLSANGWVGGLVRVPAPDARTSSHAGAVLIGAIAGALVVYSVEWLELHLTIDDPGGAISVHAVAGIWGLLAVGPFAQTPEPGQWIAQLVGVATLLGVVLPLSYGLNWLLNRFYGLRVASEGERQGLDLYELGAGAYPDFMTHNEDMWQR